MTRRELLLNTLERVTAQPRPHLENVVRRWITQDPDKRAWDLELPTADRLQLEAAFQEEAHGILAWYVCLLREDDDLLNDRALQIQKENARKLGKRSHN